MKFKHKLLAVILYSFLIVNYLDNICNPRTVPGWHLILAGIYAVLPLFISETYKELLILYITASLINDLTYAPFRLLFIDSKCLWLGKCISLLDWYMWQLGFKGLNYKWTADFLLVKVKVSSTLMGAFIWLRIIALTIIGIMEGLRKKHSEL